MSRLRPVRFGRSAWLALAVLAALVVALAAPTRAEAIERNFVGSAQLDYHLVPLHAKGKTFPQAFDGFTTELAGKLAVDFNDKLSANLKVCFGCHGFEADMMYFDYRVADELNVRVGRFSPSFGAFNLRHDPANHRLADKPLPYDMGRMLRMREWNLGVMPSPFPDNGVEVNGTHWFGDVAQLDYALYGVSGFKGNAKGTDLDFTLSRSPQAYYVDNNARPAGGGRVSLLLKLGEATDVSLGASGLAGTWDPDNRRLYVIAGSDLTVRHDKTTLRAEYLLRRQTFDTNDASAFKYTLPSSGGDFFVKHGFYTELEQGVTESLDLVARFDGIHRVGNVEKDSALSSKSTALRGTFGAAYALDRAFRLKASTELWRFSDGDGTGRQTELGFHLGAVGTF
ncbi:MAG: hypothetical protein JNL38_39715 [Myxococcales bacterium]|nr:hypothetical protein [Myxococcales bacterium]